MPELKKHAASGAMHGIGDATPAGALLVGIDAGRVGTARTLLRNRCGFCDDEARRRPLRVVLSHERRRYPARPGTHARERSHHQPVRRLNRAQTNGGEESRSTHEFGKRLQVASYDASRGYSRAPAKTRMIVVRRMTT